MCLSPGETLKLESITWDKYLHNITVNFSFCPSPLFLLHPKTLSHKLACRPIVSLSIYLPGKASEDREFTTPFITIFPLPQPSAQWISGVCGSALQNIASCKLLRPIFSKQNTLKYSFLNYNWPRKKSIQLSGCWKKILKVKVKENRKMNLAGITQLKINETCSIYQQIKAINNLASSMDHQYLFGGE